jgi:hypothetical protein
MVASFQLRWSFVTELSHQFQKKGPGATNHLIPGSEWDDMAAINIRMMMAALL